MWDEEDFDCVQLVGFMVVEWDVEDEDIARLDRLEFTQVAPVDVNG